MTRIRLLPCWTLLLLCFPCSTHAFRPPPRPARRTIPSTRKHLFPEVSSHFLATSLDPGSHFLTSAVSDVVNNLEIPFKDLGKDLAASLDIGQGFASGIGKLPEVETTLVLESMGFDALVFLAASVFVTILSQALHISPILGYLVMGALLGEHALDLFSNSKAAIELGDVGIMFLLFSEGLEVTKPRLQKLAQYLPLGFAQISLVTGVVTATILSGLPELVGDVVHLDPSFLGMNPTEAVVLGMIGCLSTSAFVFPVLKEKGWEEEESGEAATSILLLQDLLVAPLLVLLPYLADSSATDYTAIGFLTAKATIGFGLVLAIGSWLIQKLFQLVSAAQSSETFVALCLLVAGGMGTIAKYFGLTDTAGAFAAGVLLANTNYRAQIQADILPFKGILLGVFFMEAGSNFDIDLVVQEFPTILTGTLSLLLLKAATLGAATRVPRWMEPHRLSLADALRVSLLLAGGGEFAFVVLAQAEGLGLVPTTLASILTAIVLITMGITPVLGDVAAQLSEPYLDLKEQEQQEQQQGSSGTKNIPTVAHNAIVVCGYGEVGQNVVRELGQEKKNQLFLKSNGTTLVPTIVALDLDPKLSQAPLKPGNGTLVLYGNGASPEVIKAVGVEVPSAIFVTYEDMGRVATATAKLRAAFGSQVPIYARAATRRDVVVGATAVVVESDELPRAAPALVKGMWGGNLAATFVSAEHFRAEAAAVAGVSLKEADELLELYQSMNQDGTGRVCPTEIEAVLERSGRSWIASDAQIEQVEAWIEGTLRGPVSALEFCHLYGEAPAYVKEAFGLRNGAVLSTSSSSTTSSNTPSETR